MLLCNLSGAFSFLCTRKAPDTRSALSHRSTMQTTWSLITPPKPAKIYVDSQKSLTGEDRLRFSGTINKVTERNNTDQNLERHINWQYLLPPMKLFYILPTFASTPSTDGIKVWAQHCLSSEVHLRCHVCNWIHKSLYHSGKLPACYYQRLSSTCHNLRALWPTIRIRWSARMSYVWFGRKTQQTSRFGHADIWADLPFFSMWWAWYKMLRRGVRLILSILELFYIKKIVQKSMLSLSISLYFE